MDINCLSNRSCASSYSRISSCDRPDFVTASCERKSSIFTSLKPDFRASIATFLLVWLQIYSISAPVYFSVFNAKKSKSTSLAKGIPLAWTSKIAFRAFKSGGPIPILSSKRPGLRKAGSISWGLLVAPITNTRSSGFNSLSSVSNVETAVLWPEKPVPIASLRTKRPSNSSKNRIVGGFLRACTNKSWICFSVSPYHLDIIIPAEITLKLASVSAAKTFER